MTLPKKQPHRKTTRDPEAICPHGWQYKACARCRNRTSRNFGRAVQREMHQELGGTGVSPTHEETGRGYDVEAVAVKVHPEAKGGNQIPASLVKFLGTEWYRRAIGQSVRGLPIGSGSRPAVWCHLPGGRKVLVVDYGGGKGKAPWMD
jgi:hypothetical protein